MTEPAKKLDPIIKLIGKAIVSWDRKLTLLFLSLLYTPVIKIKNKVEFKISEKTNL